MANQSAQNSSHNNYNNHKQSSKLINIPIASNSKNQNQNVNQFKTPKPMGQRLILPKLSLYKTTISNASTSNSETVMSQNSNVNNYPKLTTPDLHQRAVSDLSVDSELICREGSLLKPPILTTRPTVLKPFILQSSESKS